MATNVVKVAKPSALETLDKFTQMFEALKNAQEMLLQRDAAESDLKRLRDECETIEKEKNTLEKNLKSTKEAVSAALEKARKKHEDDISILNASYVAAKSINDGKMDALNEDLESLKKEIATAKQRAGEVYADELNKVRENIKALKVECSAWEQKRDAIAGETTELERKLNEVKGKLRTVLSLNA